MKRIGALLMVLLLFAGCGKVAPEPASVPQGQPVRMISLAYKEGETASTAGAVAVTYTYETDEAGRVTARRYTLGGTAYHERTVYDAAGRAVYVISDRAADKAGTAHRYTYDGAGRCLTDETYARAGEVETLTARTTYTYGDGERAIGAAVTDESGHLRCTAAFAYTAPSEGHPDAAVLLEEMTLTAADGMALRVTCTAYDAADRPLWRETSGDSACVETYTYDTAGRLLTHISRQDGWVYEERYEY